MKMKRRIKKGRARKNERGVVLIVALTFISTIVALTLAIMTASFAEIQAAERFENRMVTFHLAEGVLDQTIVALRNDQTFTGVTTTTATNGRISGIYESTVTPSETNPNIFQIQALSSIST